MRGGKIDSMDSIMSQQVDSMDTIMRSMEMEPFEEEITSLVHETAGYDHGMMMAPRKKTVGDKFRSMKNKVTSSSSSIIPRANTFVVRSICTLCFLAAMTIYVVMDYGEVFAQMRSSTNEVPPNEQFPHPATTTGDASTEPVAAPPPAPAPVVVKTTTPPTTAEAADTPKGPFHQSRYGGINNINSPAGAKAAADGHFDNQKFIIPISHVSHAVPSVTDKNLLNLWGHYMHDEHRSPFSSHLFDKKEAELADIQKKYEEKMAKVRSEWGAWNFKDPTPTVDRDVPNFDSVDYRDVLYKDMPATAWQKDEKYVKEFIKEGKALVNRVIEGVYAEFGHPTKKADGKLMTEDEKKKRHKLFQVTILEVEERQKTKFVDGIAWMTPAAWDGFVRKLLHAMITNDIFYFVLGGHSAAAGHGNNFYQTQSMMFHHLMEPIFTRLGVTLISRNMAMGGLGTIHTSLGGAYLYGESDFTWWDSSMTEKAEPADVFNRQALLSGERVPVVISDFIVKGEKLMFGTFGRDAYKGVPESRDEKQALTLPWASRFVNCQKNRALCDAHKFDAECWIPRKDVTLKTKQGAMSGRAGWHPGYRTHKFNGRQVSMIFLHALQAAFEIWEAGMEKDKFPLPESYWHVGDLYKDIQKEVRTNETPSACANILKRTHLPERVCRIPMRGATEWFPRRNGAESSLTNYIKPAPNGYVPVDEAIGKDVYTGVDVAASTFDIPIGNVDAHAIAIASYYPPPKLDQSIRGRQRWLREQSEKVWNKVYQKKASEVLSSPSKSENLEKLRSDHRHLAGDEVVPGQGWTIHDTVPGYCDGSSNSFCGRSEATNCMLYAHNDNRGRLTGDGLSGWIVFNLPNMKEGIIAARLEWWAVRDLPTTKTWKEVNNGKTNDVQRLLKAKIPEYPDDFKFDIAINGKIVSTWDKKTFMNYSAEIMHNVAIFPIHIDDKMAEQKRPEGDLGETIELGLRVTSAKNPRGSAVTITHLYWA